MKFLTGIILAFLFSYFSLLIHDLPFAPFRIDNLQIIEPILIAIILGMVAGHYLRKYKIFEQGIDFSANYILQLAIILLGVKLNLSHLASLSFVNIFIIISSAIFAFFFTKFLAKKLNINNQIATLTAFGIAICGSSAIAVAGKTLKASKNNIATSITIITLLGSVALFLYPLLAKLLELNNQEFGVIAGTSIHSVPQSIAAGMIFSQASGETATIIKLSRILLLLPMIMILRFIEHKKQLSNTNIFIKINRFLPSFIILFILACIFSNLGFFDLNLSPKFDLSVKDLLVKLSSFFLLTSMFAIGFNSNFKHLFQISKKLIVLGSISSLLLLIFTYSLVILL